MEFKTFVYEKSDGIAVITLNRPKSMNAINDELIKELGDMFGEMANDDEVSVVILTGSEKVFAAGADIKEIAGLKTPYDAHEFTTRAQTLFNKIEGLPKPVIAAVSGLALGGGCEMSMACDIRIAAENALFGQPEITIGVLPAGGGTQRLPRLVGLGRAKEMLYSGEPIDAREAYRIGLVNKVVPVATLMEEAVKMASKFLKQPGFALKLTKMVINEGIEMDLRSAIAPEARCFEILFSTKDQKEGMAAFIEKRKPKFIGK